MLLRLNVKFTDDKVQLRQLYNTRSINPNLELVYRILASALQSFFGHLSAHFFGFVPLPWVRLLSDATRVQNILLRVLYPALNRQTWLEPGVFHRCWKYFNRMKDPVSHLSQSTTKHALIKVKGEWRGEGRANVARCVSLLLRPFICFSFSSSQSLKFKSGEACRS